MGVYGFGGWDLGIGDYRSFVLSMMHCLINQTLSFISVLVQSDSFLIIKKYRKNHKSLIYVYINNNPHDSTQGHGPRLRARCRRPSPSPPLHPPSIWTRERWRMKEIHWSLIFWATEPSHSVSGTPAQLERRGAAVTNSVNGVSVCSSECGRSKMFLMIFVFLNRSSHPSRTPETFKKIIENWVCYGAPKNYIMEAQSLPKALNMGSKVCLRASTYRFLLKSATLRKPHYTYTDCMWSPEWGHLFSTENANKRCHGTTCNQDAQEQWKCMKILPRGLLHGSQKSTKNN